MLVCWNEKEEEANETMKIIHKKKIHEKEKEIEKKNILNEKNKNKIKT